MSLGDRDTRTIPSHAAPEYCTYVVNSYLGLYAECAGEYIESRDLHFLAHKINCLLTMLVKFKNILVSSGGSQSGSFSDLVPPL